jgi:predicted TIM-barrel fold metal-dependent hydrolase
MTAGRADSHLHIFSRGMPAGNGRAVLGEDPEIGAYEAYRRAAGIVAGLVVGYEAEGIDPHNNSHIRSLAVQRPWMATVAFVDPRTLPGPGAIDALFEQGHAGIAVYLPDATASAAIAAWSDETWHILRNRRAILSLNARPAGMDDLSSVIRRHKGCRFLFSHLGLPGRYAATPTTVEAADRIAKLLALAEFDTVMVKISGLYAVSDPAHAYPHAAAAPFIDVLLDRFGPARCLWGSDFSPALEFVSFAQTLSNPWLDRLGSSERDQVMGGNLLTLLDQDGSRE